MANASVEKLKALGLRHGEKLVVGLTAAVFVACAAIAFTQESIDVKPEQLKGAADLAESNLNKPQDPNSVLEKLKNDGVVDPGFVKLVENQVANALKPGDFKVKLDWVTPEPGAGLIRDQPEVIAPTELAAFPGRGGILMYALDEKGEKIKDTGDVKVARKGNRRKGASMPGSMGGMGGSAPPEGPEDVKKRLAVEEKRKKSLVGNVDPAKEKEKAKDKGEEAVDAASQGPWKEEVKGKRWVTITGVVDNEQMNKNWLLALKNPAIAFPIYRRVDVERQVRQSDGAWTDWAMVDSNKNYAVLDNLPEADVEFVPEPKRPENLVDRLPFLRAGYWTGVHVARLVPAEIRNGSPADAAKGGGMDGYPGGMRPPGGGSMGMGASMGMGGSMGGSMGGKGGGGGAGARQGGEEGGGMSMGMGMGMGGGEAAGPVDEPVVPNTEPALMIRSLDFTVDPDTTYRFRARIVVKNPNYEHTDVNPGVDVDNQELIGPWSDPTDAVTVPADVVAYAQAPEPNVRRADLVSFQVVKWDPATGQTLVKNDDAGPGFIVGEYGQVQMPSSEGGGAKPSMIDFNSRAIVLDTLGGAEKLPEIGVQRNAFTMPVLAMVVEPDGSVVVRSQSIDKTDEVRRDMDANYRQALDDSGKTRQAGGGIGAGGSRPPSSGSAGGGGGRRRGRGRR